MAERPVFIPVSHGTGLVRTEPVQFQWFAGLSVGQKQKSVDSLHAAAMQRPGIAKLLEVSSKSRAPLGVALSAFNLTFTVPDQRVLSVECAFQGSKVFERGGPYTDLFDITPREAKRDDRLRSSGRLTGFSFFGAEWALQPKTAFYDWLYLGALRAQPALVAELGEYSTFTDIEFNPERSLNCQAAAIALLIALSKRSLLERALSSQAAFLAVLTECQSE